MIEETIKDIVPAVATAEPVPTDAPLKESEIAAAPAAPPVLSLPTAPLVAHEASEPVVAPATSPASKEAFKLVGEAFWRPSAMLHRLKTPAYIYSLDALPDHFVLTSKRLVSSGGELDPTALHGAVLVLRDPQRQQEVITSPVLV